MTRFEARASTILHHLLRAGPARGPWLLPANVCPVVPITFLDAGRPFELVDVEPDTLCVDRSAVLGRLRRDPVPGGVLFVRTYGVALEIEPFFEALRKAAPEVAIVDDRCLCWPAFDGLDRTAADVVLHSTGYAKPVDAGGGGYAWTSARTPWARYERPYEPADLARVTEDYKRAVVERAPFVLRHAAWLDTRPPVEPFEAYRARVASLVPVARERHAALTAIYREGLPREVRLPDAFHGWRFQIVVPRRDELVAALFARGLYAGTHYAPLGGVFGPGAFPVAARLWARVVNLFSDLHYTEEQARETVQVVREHLDRVGGAPAEPWPL